VARLRQVYGDRYREDAAALAEAGEFSAQLERWIAQTAELIDSGGTDALAN
jgi:hypothetical protein